MTSKLIGLNILAIFLVEDHPGHPYVDRAVSSGLAGEYRLLVPDPLPLRARWILTNRWGVDRLEGDRAVEEFLQQCRGRHLGTSRTTPHRAFELSKTLRTDVYDTV